MAALRLPRPVSRIWIRLLAFNVLLVFLPAAGFLYLDTYERQLLEAQERSMVQQGRILAASLSQQGELSQEGAREVLERLGQRQTARLRVLDRDARLLADTSLLGPLREPGEEARYPSEEEDLRGNPLYRLGAALVNLLQGPSGPPSREGPPREFYASDRPFRGPEVAAALSGRYGATTRRSPGQRSVTLYSALPVASDGEVVGAVLVSQSTLRLLADLYAVRLAVFKAFLASLAVAAVLSLLVSGTIARPIRKLRREAAAFLDRRGRVTGRFTGSSRQDEIGDLARALERLSRRLEEHLGFIESFAADVSHELKNPLASIRAATELLAEIEEPEERRLFIARVLGDIARMESLLAAVQEITVLDARLEEEEREAVDLGALLANLVEARGLRRRRGVEVAAEMPGAELVVRAAPERLAQAFENLLDNASSFAPEGSRVEVRLERDGGAAVAQVADRGPGIPPEHLERIFSRFFSYRPGAAAANGRHAGLGLAIVQAVVEGYGGTVAAANRPGGGAAFTVRLPLAQG